MAEVSGSAYTQLPQTVQGRINNLSGSAFSIQQLLFDHSNAGLSSTPRIDGVEPGSVLETILNRFFVSKYVAKLRDMSEPMLGCAVAPRQKGNSTMTLTDLNFSVRPSRITRAQVQVRIECGFRRNQHHHHAERLGAVLR